ncbi:MAG: beta-lactamase family protein [Robiginitomaculum sp.]|nr:beta-lactamase family protein [Robiginitomaculum sp.]
MRKLVFKFLWCVVLSVLVSSCQSTMAVKTTPAPTEIQFQSAINAIYEQHPDAIGIMVHVEAPRNNISWSGATGFSDKSRKTPIDAKAIAWIASNTKTYVAVATLRLVEDGQFNVQTTIDKLLSSKTITILRNDGYEPETITVEHLLSHTSGIFDYAADLSYFEFTKQNPKHRWTRDAQIKLAMEKGDPLGAAGDVFTYADTNYLLLSEILERSTGKPFYYAIRYLIGLRGKSLDETWFLSLEVIPPSARAPVHQYATSMGLDTQSVDPSFDLFGGGGLVSTTRDLAVFMQYLFNGKIFHKPETLLLLQTKANPKQGMKFDYRFGLSTIEVHGLQGIGHGGFWATAVNYFPELDASIAVFILERDQRVLRQDVNQAVVRILQDEEQQSREK